MVRSHDRAYHFRRVIVLETTRPVVAVARQVRICDPAIARWAERATREDLAVRGPGGYGRLRGSREQLANLVLLIDSLNFCFWGPAPRYEAEGVEHRGFAAMLAAFVDAVRREPRWADAGFWCEVSSAELRRALSPGGELPLLDEREQIVRQTGRTLLDRFDGQFAAAVDSVNGRAWDVAALLLVSFDSFRDVAQYDGQPVFFAKRAQIAALDLSLTWVEHGHEPLIELERLTAFADYRLPQILRHLGIIEVDADLAERIDSERELAAGSMAEVELRAATIIAVERMSQALAARGLDAPPWRIDCHLWDRSHDPSVRVAHHRTRTIYY